MSKQFSSQTDSTCTLRCCIARTIDNNYKNYCRLFNETVNFSCYVDP